MYFVPKHTKMYAWFLHIKPMQRYLFTVFVVSAAVFSWLGIIFFPLSSHIDQYQRHIKQLQEQEIILEQSKHACIQLDKSLQDMQIAVRSCTHEASSQTVIQAGMLFIINHAQKCGLGMHGCTAGEQIDNVWYTKNKANVVLNGTLNLLIQFFNGLNTPDYLVASHHISLARTMQDNFDLTCALNFISIK